MGEEGENLYRSASKELMRGTNNATKDFKIASNPLKAMILDSYSYLRFIEKGEKVLFYLMEGNNPNAF